MVPRGYLRPSLRLDRIFSIPEDTQALDFLRRTLFRPALSPLRNATRNLTSDATNVDFILESWSAPLSVHSRGGRFLVLIWVSDGIRAADIPHPDKKHKGGEDAYFILTRSPADGSSSIGVADGVGGWAEVDVDAGACDAAP
eukprot:2555458-Rhodomonas_salina.3